MTSTVQEQTIPYLTHETKAKPFVSWQAFEKKYLSREDGMKYEWNNGVIEKTPATMRKKQPKRWYILKNLQLFFQKLTPHPQGLLLQEADIFLNPTRHKKPDIGYATFDQIDSDDDTDTLLPFIIEIISPTDSAYKVQEKVKEYIHAGVKVVWHIYPNLEEVHIYEDETQAKICYGDAICSAEKVILGFALPAKEIFKKKKP